MPPTPLELFPVGTLARNGGNRSALRDSIRLGQFEPTLAQFELMRIGEEVDHLTAFIDQSLGGFRRTDPAHPSDMVPGTGG